MREHLRSNRTIARKSVKTFVLPKSVAIVAHNEHVKVGFPGVWLSNLLPPVLLRVKSVHSKKFTVTTFATLSFISSDFVAQMTSEPATITIFDFVISAKQVDILFVLSRLSMYECRLINLSEWHIYALKSWLTDTQRIVSEHCKVHFFESFQTIDNVNIPIHSD